MNKNIDKWTKTETNEQKHGQMNKKTGQMNKNMDKEEGNPARTSETRFKLFLKTLSIER